MRPDVSHLFAGPGCDLSIRSIWEDLCIHGLKVPWHKLVWFPGRIPKHSTILWMTILDRLPTRMRLLRMGLNIDNDKCLFYDTEHESCNHLLFGCGFAQELWGNVLSLCGVKRCVSAWDKELAWASQLLKGKTFIVQVLKLALAGHVYNIWRERNNRLFGGRGRMVGDAE
ncbi:uncharacterized protein LOC120154075 [Hibiscus syriacus]|uniref:uncharacterized protein LOC120154075 n=1 Tax=Hibiscus syriacus TaxID=106335 RepID=UPI001923B7C8|nr:uncharacterized protein LOC120154075 [Hibiscus syriacus]